ncbi:NAD(P)/FAD-dependent oxidoreductase [Desulfosediminicola flagellatus]|uniref:NAD(P)/FAD-dependent oxidoreductase n=1 Tax=Desulfosediminicola flagellatus TaxID=2569541 RepID=UPI0010AC2BC4|nr:NAD(P)/FAD-dependent oxidoreductase [Desulfosediminicola flagellatus]
MSKADGPKGAILQRDKKTYAIVPRIPAGVIKREHLKALSNVVEKYDIPIVKITSGHRIALVGMTEEQILPIYEDLGMNEGKAVELCLHYVQACPGTEVCKFGIQDSLGFGMQLEEVLSGIEMPAKFKVGVSGCPFLCAESLVRDLGLIGKKNGWTLVFGGNSGRKVREADVLAEDLSADEATNLAQKCIDFYTANAKKRERAGAFVERVGLEEFKKAVL